LLVPAPLEGGCPLGAGGGPDAGAVCAATAASAICSGRPADTAHIPSLSGAPAGGAAGAPAGADAAKTAAPAKKEEAKKEPAKKDAKK